MIGWVIPPKENSEFVANMERVLDVYKRPYDKRYPVVCMDESPRQLIDETRVSLPMEKGQPAKIDYEYKRCGVYNVFIANEPLIGKRYTKLTERKTKKDWAIFLKEIAHHYRDANKITLIMDNLRTHSPGALYETFSPGEAKKLWDRFEFVYTPKHGSWLNMAEIELNVLAKQCLNRRISKIEKAKAEVEAWTENRNSMNAIIDWQFTTKNARRKLKRLYPSYNV